MHGAALITETLYQREEIPLNEPRNEIVHTFKEEAVNWETLEQPGTPGSAVSEIYTIPEHIIEILE